MVKANYLSWVRFGFWYGAAVAIIFAVLSIILGAFFVLINPVFGFFGVIGFFAFILIGIFIGIISVIRFMIGRFLYSYQKPNRNDYWRVVTISILGSLPWWIVGLFFTFLGISIGGISLNFEAAFLIMFSIFIDVIVILSWSYAFVWAWKTQLNKRVPI